MGMASLDTTTLEWYDYLQGGSNMTALLEEAFQKALSLPEDVQAIVAKEWIEDIAMYQRKISPENLPPLPEFHGGGARVDIADREALYEEMKR